MPPRDPLARLEDIRDAIDKVQAYASRDPSLSEELLVEGILYNLAVIGEAIKDLPDSVKTLAPDADWSPAAKMRDMVIHRYFGTNRQVVATTVQKDLPTLRQVVQRLLDELS